MEGRKIAGIMMDTTGRKIIIRNARREECTTVWNIRKLAILAQCLNDYPAERISRWTSGNPPDNFADIVEKDFFVAEVAGELDSNIAGVGKIDLESGKIDAIFVHPGKMRSGIGAGMIRHLEQLAIDHGLTQLSLEATLNAVPFYRSCGFEVLQRAQYHSPMGFSLDCMLMTKQLTQSRTNPALR
jgi:GNAT superfamily N-acetyltransferase